MTYYSQHSSHSCNQRNKVGVGDFGDPKTHDSFEAMALLDQLRVNTKTLLWENDEEGGSNDSICTFVLHRIQSSRRTRGNILTSCDVTLKHKSLSSPVLAASDWNCRVKVLMCLY